MTAKPEQDQPDSKANPGSKPLQNDRNMGTRRSLIVISWDGKGEGPPCYREDVAPDYDLLVMSYLGSQEPPTAVNCAFVSAKCECKGDIYRVIYDHLSQTGEVFAYVALIDDDIEITSSQINDLLNKALRFGLDGFAPALSHHSHHSWPETLARAGSEWHPVEILEIMMPFYAYDLFMAGGPFYQHSVSGYGVDRFVLMLYQHLLDRGRLGIIDTVVVNHSRPVTSHLKRFRNGRNSWEERVYIRKVAMRHVEQHHPDLIGTRWYMHCYANPGGPLRFWGPWLAWPWLYLRGARARRRLAR